MIVRGVRSKNGTIPVNALGLKIRMIKQRSTVVTEPKSFKVEGIRLQNDMLITAVLRRMIKKNS